MAALAAVYNAFIEAKVKPESATAAMAALEETRDEPWKRKTEATYADLKIDMARLETRMESGFARLNALAGVIISMLVGVILVGVGILVQV